MAAHARRTAEAIWRAWQGGETIAELPAELRPATAAEGWQAQAALEDLAGSRIGWKLAATTEAGRRHIRVERALPGRLFERFAHPAGAVVECPRVLRVAEAELAYRLGAELSGPGPYAARDVRSAVAALHLAVELPDTRIRRFAEVGEAQLLADCACAGLFVLGPSVAGWDSVDTSRLPVAIEIDGVEAARGTGENVMGDPLLALTWLANELVSLGTPLREGELVTTGTITVPVPVAPGNRIEAVFSGLGRVAVSLGPAQAAALPLGAAV